MILFVGCLVINLTLVFSHLFILKAYLSDHDISDINAVGTEPGARM
jgi:hypothetical protein